jgi:serine/threonine protein kinase
MEYMEKGSLYDLLGKIKLSAEQQKQMALDIARGLHYLHTQGVCHRDLKSANILVDAYGKAKLTDFGLSKTNAVSVKTIHERSQAFQWQAPEFFKRGEDYTAKSDIYSYGVILWELVTGQRPYAQMKEKELIDFILKGNRETIPDTAPKEYKDIIQGCWHTDPNKRLELATIIHQLEAYQPRPASPSPEEYYQQGIEFEKKKDYEHAYPCYEKSANKGYFRGQTNLGLFLLVGKGGMKPDKPKAHQLFLTSAQKGHVRGMFNLAMMLKSGDGIPQDIPGAMKWFKQAAEKGDQEAEKEYQKLKASTAQPAYQEFDASNKLQPKFA